MTTDHFEYKPFRHDLVFRHTIIACSDPLVVALHEFQPCLPLDLQVQGHDVNLAKSAADTQIRTDAVLSSLNHQVIVATEMQNYGSSPDRSKQEDLIRRLFAYGFGLLQHAVRTTPMVQPNCTVVLFAAYDPFRVGKEYYELGLVGNMEKELADQLHVGWESSFLRVLLVNAPTMAESEAFPLLAKICKLMVDNVASDEGSQKLLDVSRRVQESICFRKEIEMIEALLERAADESKQELATQLTTLHQLIADRADKDEILSYALANTSEITDLINRYR